MKNQSLLKNLFLTTTLALSLSASANANIASARSLALELATTSQQNGGLGCSSAAIAKAEQLDNDTFRVVLYADCIECLHVYMIDKKTEEIVFSQSVVLQDPKTYRQTCVIDRSRYLH